MPVEPQDPNRLAWETLIEGTNEKVVHALVPGRDTMQDSDADILIQLGTKLGDTRFANFQSCHPSWKDYILANVNPRTQEGGLYTKFTFGRDYSSVNPDTGLPWSQTPVLVQESLRDHYWPPILRRLQVIPDPTVMKQSRYSNGVNGGVSLYPSINVYYDLIEEMTEGTKFVEEDYISNTPFEVPKTKVPVPRVISVPLPGGERFTFRRCLCAEIKLNRILTSTSVIFDSGSVGNGIGGSIPGQIIPATNFETWRPYIKSAEQGRSNGLFTLKVTWVYPPHPPEPTTLLQ